MIFSFFHIWLASVDVVLCHNIDECTGLSVDDASASVPDMLHNFLVWLMSDKYHAVVQSTKISVEDPATCRRVQSIAQDVMFATASAIPPKHIVLALTLHHLFRSEKLTTMLNRLGHCIAYSQVLERETKMAEDKLVAGHVVDQLPDVINPSKGLCIAM